MLKHLLLCSLLALAAAASATDLQTAQEIEDCVSGSMPDTTSVQTITFKVKDRIGAVVETKAKIHAKKFEDGLSKLMIRFFLPADLRGAGLLMLEKEKEEFADMFIYLPELRRTKRVTTRMVSGSMFGTDFSYEDFERLQGFVNDAASERLEDAEIDGKQVYVIQTRPSEDSGSGYQRVVQYVDREMCVPLKTELFEREERPRKVMTTDRSAVTREGESWIPRLVLMRDLRDETETKLVIEEVEVGGEIRQKMFSQSELERGGH